MATVVNSSGIRHPNTFSVSQGKTLYSKEIDSINQSISLILRTVKGELFGDPEFGSNLHQYVFDIISGTATESLVKEEIVNSINTYETRVYVEIKDIDITYSNTTVKINIRYHLRYTDYTSEYQYTINKEESVIG